MRRWLLLLGGPLVWAAHFNLSYAINSISFQAAHETVPLARVLIVGAGAAAVLACIFVVWAALRTNEDDEFDRFSRIVAAAGGVLGAIGIFWQSLPALAPI